MTDKSEIRRKIKNMRKMLDEADKAIAAEAVFNQLEKTAAFIMAKRILMYHSLPDEVSTHAFLRKWAFKMRNVFYTSKFSKDFKTAIRRNLDISLIKAVMRDLENEFPLDPKYKEHPLTGKYIGHLECHIQPDWLLIYLIEGNDLTFVRTGTHSDLF